jgi:hypothetical protein
VARIRAVCLTVAHEVDIYDSVFHSISHLNRGLCTGAACLQAGVVLHMQVPFQKGFENVPKMFRKSSEKASKSFEKVSKKFRKSFGKVSEKFSRAE